MTVETTTCVQTYLGNGSTTEFSYFFKVIDIDHFVIERQVVETGLIDKTYTQDEFTVQGLGNDAGLIEILDTPLTSDHRLIISRVVPYTQPSDIINQSGFFPQVVEDQLDLTTMQVQQIAEQAERSLRAPFGEVLDNMPPAAERAGGYLGFDAEGNPVAAAGTGADSALRTDLAAHDGASLIGVRRTGYTGDVLSLLTILNDLRTDHSANTFEEALTAAAGKILLVTQDWEFEDFANPPNDHACAVIIPENTKIIGWGGSLTLTGGLCNFIGVEDGVTIEDLDIFGPENGGEAANMACGCGIYIRGVNNIAVRRNKITGFNAGGILYTGSNYITIEDNRLWNNTGSANASDIMGYSAPELGSFIKVMDNWCLSDNSQGIYCSPLGGDSHYICTGNHCISCESDGVTETATPVRRHGIIAGYNGDDLGGQIVVSNNVTKNTKWTGIYITNSGLNGLTPATIVSNNICTKMGHTPDVSGGLQGGIYINGGNSIAIIANNAVYDFNGPAGSSHGGIVVNPIVADTRTLIVNNSVDGSSVKGIVVKGNLAKGVVIRGNFTRHIDEQDIYIENTALLTTQIGYHVVEDNDCFRSNENFPSIEVSAQAATTACFIQKNKLTGAGTTNTASNKNSGILWNAATSPMLGVIEQNIIRNYCKGISFMGYVTGRSTTFRIRMNDMFDLTNGYVLVGADSVPTAMIEPGIMSNVTNNFNAGSQVGNTTVAHFGRVTNGRFEVYDLNAKPTTGTWAVGDAVRFHTPTAGNPNGADCITAGNPGTWKHWPAIEA